MFKNAITMLTIAALMTTSGCLKEWRNRHNSTPTQQHVDALGTAIASKPEQFYSVYDENLGEFTQQHEMLAWAQEHDATKLEFSPICFGYDSYTITPDQEEILKRNIARCKEYLQQAPDQKLAVVIEGHACNAAGKQEYNKKISDRRARAVYDRLVKAGIPADSIRVVACGAEKTMVPGDRIAQAPNRRCEMRIVQA